MKQTRYRKEENWLRARQQGMTSSDAAAIMGVSKWASPLSVYASKKAKVFSKTTNEYFHWGHVLEEPIAKEFALRNDVKIINPGEYTIQQNDERTWQICTVDRFIKSGGILEIKTAGSSKDWEDGVPIQYQVQVQHQLATTGIMRAWLAVLIAGSDYRQYEIERDPAFIEAMNRAEEAFWTNHVLAEIEPSVDGMDATTKAIKELHPVDDGAEIELPEIADDHSYELEGLKQSIAELSERKVGIENWLRQQIGDATAGVTPMGIRWTHKADKRGIRILRRN